MESVGFKTRPYHLYVPSFGQWGFFLASLQDFEVNPSVSVPTRYLEEASLRSMFVFPKDMAPVPAEVQKLNSQVLVRYFEDEWSKVN
jgi:spermidine synthase